MRQFRIVHTESSLGWGGQEWRVFLELEWMRSHGHEVWLLAPPHSEIFQRAKKVGIRVEPMTGSRFAMPWEVSRQAAFYQRHEVDIVNTHSSRDSWAGGIAARVAQVPLVIRSRHIEVDYPNMFLSRVNFEGLHDHVITTSHQIAKRLIRENGINADHVTCLPTGVDPLEFRPQPGGRLHQELHLPPELPIVGMISVVRSWKGHKDFIGAVSHLKKCGIPVHFIVAGGGNGQEWVQRKIREAQLEDRITFLGYRSDVAELLASLAAVVLPSRAHEGIPQILLQAQMVGCPVIGTRVGGIPEIIQHGKTGLLISPYAHEELASAIQEVITNPQQARCRADCARKVALAQHTLDHMGEALLKLYEHYLPLTR